MKPKLQLKISTFLVAFALLPFSPARAAVTSQSIAVPMYEYPTIGTFWDDITSAGGSSIPFVIVNPASGPGISADAIYTGEIAENTADSIRSIGYVYSNYQDRPYQEVLDDINTWYQLYPGISGIFIDLVEDGGAAEQCYISALYNHVKNTQPNDLVILNPGTNLSAAYEPYGDIFLNAENTYAAYQSTWSIQHPGFEDNPAYQNRFWQILHTVSSGAEYTSALNLLRANNAGWVYITDDVMPNPYMNTPAYWLTELNDVSTLPASSIPNREKTTLPSGCISLSADAQSTYDRAAATHTVTHSNVAVTNTSGTYASEPTTKLELTVVPSGASVTSLSGSGWSCNTGTRTCTYANALTANGSAPTVASAITADCTYAGGDATARVTNFAGNTWDVALPLQAPTDCTSHIGNASVSGTKKFSVAGKKASVVTTSVETTPPLTSALSEESATENKTTEGFVGPPSSKNPAIGNPASSSSRFWLAMSGVSIVVLAGAGLLWRRRRQRRGKGRF